MKDSTIIESEQFSAQRVDAMRKLLKEATSDRDFTIIANGSFARKEASSESDLDYFVLCDSEGTCTKARKVAPKIKKALETIVPKGPAKDGAFAEVESLEKMITNIGGQQDDNHKITRRILFLLEGDWLFNEAKFIAYREKILDKYVLSSISDHQFCRFLLNDLIRYYRTICVDFEHKTEEAGKSWGTRNIKLIFSRKLLYFSGIIAAAETWQHTYNIKRRRLTELLAMTPIRRIEAVCGKRADQALGAYGQFLRKMADPAIRRMLDGVPKDRLKQPAEFRLFKNEGHHFSWMLVKLLRETYDPIHPIHNALVV